MFDIIQVIHNICKHMHLLGISLKCWVSSLKCWVSSLKCWVSSLKCWVLICVRAYVISFCNFRKYIQVFAKIFKKKKNGKESQPAWTKTKPLYVKLTDQNRTVTVSLFTLLDERENDLLLHYRRECSTRSSDLSI